jgi:hypothetical protein
VPSQRLQRSRQRRVRQRIRVAGAHRHETKAKRHAFREHGIQLLRIETADGPKSRAPEQAPQTRF